ncbi:MAG: hypothetical protein WDN50_10925 [Bradyrhizobium sp.]
MGWLGPGLTQTLETPEFLAEAGVKYVGDWVYDDEPTVIRTAKGPLVTLPYTIELNDIPMMMVQHHESDHMLKRTIDCFDRLYAESAQRPKFLSLAIHPYIFRPAVPDQISRSDLRLCKQVRRRRALERRADSRLVSGPDRGQAAGMKQR